MVSTIGHHCLILDTHNTVEFMFGLSRCASNMKFKQAGRRKLLPLIVLLLGGMLILSNGFWVSPGHWWFGKGDYRVKINDIAQGDYEIYRSLNGDVLVICWDHMTEYYVSVKEQKVWEINRRQEVTVDGDYFLYFRHSLTADGV